MDVETRSGHLDAFQYSATAKAQRKTIRKRGKYSSPPTGLL